MLERQTLVALGSRANLNLLLLPFGQARAKAPAGSAGILNINRQSLRRSSFPDLWQSPSTQRYTRLVPSQGPMAGPCLRRGLRSTGPTGSNSGGGQALQLRARGPSWRTSAHHGIATPAGKARVRNDCKGEAFSKQRAASHCEGRLSRPVAMRRTARARPLWARTGSPRRHPSLPFQEKEGRPEPSIPIRDAEDGLQQELRLRPREVVNPPPSFTTTGNDDRVSLMRLGADQP
jgi:hypothetical protein